MKLYVKTVLSTPSRAMLAIAAGRTNIPWGSMKFLGMEFYAHKVLKPPSGFPAPVFSFLPGGQNSRDKSVL